jgi:hypothetical protein
MSYAASMHQLVLNQKVHRPELGNALSVLAAPAALFFFRFRF